jgi:sulfate adenylyltransferase
VASLIVQAGGIVLAAPIAPYAESREHFRRLVEAVSPNGFIEVFVDAPLAECERRDRKGLYRRARAVGFCIHTFDVMGPRHICILLFFSNHQGLLPHMTGIDDPYEVPERPDLRLPTDQLEIVDALNLIKAEIQRRGFIDQFE